MTAAVLHAFGSPLSVETLPDPVLGTGEVLVDIAAAPVQHYAAEVLSGARQYMLGLPIVPGAGAVGRVRALGPDATRLAVGDWVSCDPTVRARDDAQTPDITLQGVSARGPGGLHLQQYYHDGSFAEQMRVPTENAVQIGNIDASEAGAWCALNLMLVRYGGLLAAGLAAGETLVVSGATGTLGSAGVAVALAMGAGCVVAPGRNEAVLADLVRRFGACVRPVVLTGDEATDREAIKQAAPGPIDVVLDLLPPSASTVPVRAAAMTVREYGRVVLMGGVGMLGGDDFGLPYPWIMRNSITIRGQWMYPREAPARLVRLVRSGRLDLGEFTITAFPLAAANGGPFRLTVLQP